MNKIQYPENWKELYLKIFSDDLKILQQQWRLLRKNNPELKKLPQRIRTILTANFSKLTDMFFDFNKLPQKVKKCFLTEENGKKQRYINIFDYKKYSNRIAKFFYEHSCEMNIHSCFYCDIHTIGKYSKEVNDREKTYWRTFDLDHFFPQKQCPILALSLQNFIPSCQICNSRVKGSTELLKFYGIKKMSEGQQKGLLKMISPTSENYNFNNNATIIVLPKKGFDKKISFLNNIKSYRIIIDSTINYYHEIKAFRLQPRYNSIPILSEALSILDLRQKFPLAKIKEIQQILNKSKKYNISIQEIEETIFRKEYDKKRKSTLIKLKLDLLE